MAELIASAASLVGVLAIVWFRRLRRKRATEDLGSWTIP